MEGSAGEGLYTNLPGGSTSPMTDFWGQSRLTPPSPLKSLTAFFGNQGAGNVDSPDLPLGGQVWRPASLSSWNTDYNATADW